MSYQTVIHELTDLIFEEMRALGNEQSAPSYDADRSDDYMKRKKTTVRELRLMRSLAEHLATEATLE